MKKLLNYVSFHGRTNRMRYWRLILAFWGVMIVFGLASSFVMSNDVLVGILALVMLPVFLGLSVALVANVVRRLHDRNKSAWWALLFMGVPVLLLLPSELARGTGAVGAQAAGALLALVSLPFSIWGFVELGCLRGTTGPNKYGDDPIGPIADPAPA